MSSRGNKMLDCSYYIAQKAKDDILWRTLCLPSESNTSIILLNKVL